MPRHRVFAIAHAILPHLGLSPDAERLSELALLAVEVATPNDRRRHLNRGRRRVIALWRLHRMRRSQH